MSKYSDKILEFNPIAHYTMGESSGTTMIDLSPNSNDGTYVNSPTLGETGLLIDDLDSSVYFDGINDYAIAGFNRKLSDRNLTTYISFIFKSDLIDSNEVIIGNERASSSGRELFIEIRSDGKLSISIDALSSSPYTIRYLSTTSLISNEIYHIVIGLNQSTYYIYINGELDSIHDANHTFTIGDGNFTNINISRHRNYTYSTQYSELTIDELSFFDYELTEDQISLLYDFSINEIQAITGITLINGIISECIVRLYSNSTGDLIEEKLSSDTTGEYSFIGLDQTKFYYVVCIDPSDLTCHGISAKLSPKLLT